MRCDATLRHGDGDGNDDETLATVERHSCALLVQLHRPRLRRAAPAPACQRNPRAPGLPLIHFFVRPHEFVSASSLCVLSAFLAVPRRFGGSPPGSELRLSSCSSFVRSPQIVPARSLCVLLAFLCSSVQVRLFSSRLPVFSSRSPMSSLSHTCHSHSQSPFVTFRVLFHDA